MAAGLAFARAIGHHNGGYLLSRRAVGLDVIRATRAIWAKRARVETLYHRAAVLRPSFLRHLSPPLDGSIENITIFVAGGRIILTRFRSVGPRGRGLPCRCAARARLPEAM